MYNYLEKRQFNPTQKHFMFEMATGSGKTLVMAGLILECYKQGYQNFIFFVNSASILEKTKLNFTDSASSKYLFSENININDENTEIKSINNLNESHNNAINIYFSTIQGLFSLFTRAKENAITIEDLKDQKLVFLADETHHLNTETKKKLNDSEASEKRNWESVVKLALKSTSECLKIFNALNERILKRADNKIDKIDSEEFQNLDLNEQKRICCASLDSNEDYLNLGDIDEDAWEIDEITKKYNKIFYS
ncbi:DEAD/DEAH box helicase family protein [Helicobacter pylori]|uniref:DEAD/DEAH box helicase family protein n=1 Tax=Helicobacter pylori TaxID=210 RepID=UPI0025758288|nr:DEAD/DEAH box helicase family protein [Helicobacter pylori]WJI96200.1 DEAD/DEAH box helicase family protein [Helicobacter pylori]